MGPVHDNGYIHWVTRSPVAKIGIYSIFHFSEPVGTVLVHRDIDRLERKRTRILDIFLLQVFEESFAEIIGDLIDELIAQFEIDYIDAEFPIYMAKWLKQAGLNSNVTKTLWYWSRQIQYDDNAHWGLTLLDKDDTFRGSGLIS